MKTITTTLLLCISLQFFGQINENLLLYYPMNGSVNDYSGNDNHGIPFGVTYTTDRFDNPDSACHFNGVDNFVNFPNIEALKADLPVSFTFWIKYDSTSYQTQAVLNTSFEDNMCTGVWFNSRSSDGHYAVNYGDGSNYYSPDTRRTYVSNAPIDITDWHFISIVITAAENMEIYVDGVENGGEYSGYGESLVYSLTPGCIGRHDRNLDLPADYFMGSIDDFAYWGGKALTPEEVNLLRTGAVTLNTPVNELAEKVSVYPNPAHDMLYIDSNFSASSAALVNSLGQQVYSGAYKSGINVSNLPAGVYFLKFEGIGQTKKIIIK